MSNFSMSNVGSASFPAERGEGKGLRRLAPASNAPLDPFPGGRPAAGAAQRGRRDV